MEKVTVLIPVGPNYNLEWLQESLDSVINQTYHINELLIIDDGACLKNIRVNNVGFEMEWEFDTPVTRTYDLSKEGKGVLRYMPPTDISAISYYKLPANVGFTAAFNIGMGLVSSDLVVYLAADDKLMPTAIERAVHTYLDNSRKDAWYAFAYETSDGDSSSIPCNAALITRGLWSMVGGYPPAAFVGPDALILSCLMAHAPDRIVRVDEGISLYWIREHDGQETKTHTWKYVNEMNSIRGKVTAEFKLKEL